MPLYDKAAGSLRANSHWRHLLHDSEKLLLLSILMLPSGSAAPNEKRMKLLKIITLALSLLATPASGQVAGASTIEHLEIVSQGIARAPIVVAAEAGPWETRAAEDLRKYIKGMTGVEPPLLYGNPPPTGAAILVGRLAIQENPSLAGSMRSVAKRTPVVQADAIVVRRDGDRLYLAGTNDESHYFAVSWLLQQWGCRWYLPTAFGEVVPRHPYLSIGALDHLYAPPFEIRHYWISWEGDKTDAEEFRHRNFMSSAQLVGMGHALGDYTIDIAPPGGSHLNVPFSDPKTAEHVARKIESEYAAGKDISLAISDGRYSSDGDRTLISDYDKYMLMPSLTDAMLTFYNNVSDILRNKYPESPSKIGGLAYSNVTLPPSKVMRVAPNIVMWLAPIDIDPNHSMDDPRSPPRREYGDMVRAWAQVTDGRLAIYDYDQGMLVWRDIPHPSHHVFARDVREYRRLGILGVGTESRGAMATVFLNLFFRGQLMWNPDLDVDAALREFYPAFFGAAAAPMERYWSRIFKAWQETDITEHEYMAAPAIYTPTLLRALRGDLIAAEAIIGEGEGVYSQRLRFVRASFDVLSNYMALATAAARESNYQDAVLAGERALAARRKLAELNPTFTTRVIGRAAETPALGPAWLPGEVEQMKNLRSLTDGSRGSLLTKTPLIWSFNVESPLRPGWTYQGPEGAKPAAISRAFASEEPSAANGWKEVHSDLYLQAQGVLSPDGQAPLGHYWYQSTISIPPDSRSRDARIMFPGLFNEAWLYVNGKLVEHRNYNEPWWLTDYRFEWDVHIGHHLKPGRNVIALRGFNPHHFGGMFRRPFLYRPATNSSRRILPSVPDRSIPSPPIQ